MHFICYKNKIIVQNFFSLNTNVWLQEIDAYRVWCPSRVLSIYQQYQFTLFTSLHRETRFVKVGRGVLQTLQTSEATNHCPAVLIQMFLGSILHPLPNSYSAKISAGVIILIFLQREVLKLDV